MVSRCIRWLRTLGTRAGQYHTHACQRAATTRWKERAAWEARWPNYCRSCEGWGEVVYVGSQYEPPESDPCPRCSEQGHCPRCGGATLNDDNEYAHCGACGWKIGGKGCQLPPAYECEGCTEHALEMQRRIEV